MRGKRYLEEFKTAAVEKIIQLWHQESEVSTVWSAEIVQSLNDFSEPEPEPKDGGRLAA